MQVDSMLRTLRSLPEALRNLSLKIIIEDGNLDEDTLPHLRELSALLTSDSFSCKVSKLDFECHLWNRLEGANTAVVQLFQKLKVAYSHRLRTADPWGRDSTLR